MTDQAVEPEVVDATVVTDQPGTDLAPVSGGTQLLRPLADPEEVRGAMVAYQQTLDAILDPSDWQVDGRTRFVKKSGWRKIAKAFGLSVTIVHEDIVRDDHGAIVRAKVIARAAAPNGQVFDGDGYCSIDEPRFKKDKGRQKLENDLPTTATTRAMNRAISSLVGFGEVSADELTASAGAVPVWAEQASDGHDKQARQALGQLVGDPDTAAGVYRDLLAMYDLPLLPAGVAAALSIVAARSAA